MDDKKFAVYQGIRDTVISAMYRADYNRKDIEDALRMLREDINEEFDDPKPEPKKFSPHNK